MPRLHRNLTREKWRSLPRSRQILHIASELTRAGNWWKDRQDYTRHSLERSLELIDFCVDDRDLWHGTRLRELLRFREVVAELYCSGAGSGESFPVLIRVLIHLDSEAVAMR